MINGHGSFYYIPNKLKFQKLHYASYIITTNHMSILIWQWGAIALTCTINNYNHCLILCVSNCKNKNELQMDLILYNVIITITSIHIPKK
jgi:hypothetical protein